MICVLNSRRERILVLFIFVMTSLLLGLVIFWPSLPQDIQPNSRGKSDSVVDMNSLEQPVEKSNQAAGSANATVIKGEWTPTSESKDNKGQLSIRFLDGKSGELVPDVHFTVYSEHTGKTYGRGIADTMGEAHISGLPLFKTIIVESERLAPYTFSLGAAWLVNSEAVEIDVRMMVGGSISGRLVDESGSPISGGDIKLLHGKAGFRDWSGRGSLVAKSADDGRFVVDNLVSRGYAIWVVGGEHKVERYRQVGLEACTEDAGELIVEDVAEGETIDVGDVTLLSRVFVQGVVVNEAGEGQAGYFISLSQERNDIHDFGKGRLTDEEFARWSAIPGDSKFRLERYECITDSDGRFEVEWQQDLRFWLLILNADGNRLRYREPMHDDPQQEWKIKIPQSNFMKFELLDPDGNRLQVSDEVHMHSTSSLKLSRAFEVRLQGSSGLRIDSVMRIGPGGYYYLEVPAKANPHMLLFTLPSFLPVEEDFPELLDLEAKNGVISLELIREEKRQLRFHVKRGEGKGIMPDSWNIKACVCRPKFYEGNRGCCGLASSIRLERRSDRQLVIPVDSSREYWLDINAFSKAKKGVISIGRIGPFLPGEEVHDLELGRVVIEKDTLLPHFPEHPAEDSKVGAADFTSRANLIINIEKTIKDEWVWVRGVSLFMNQPEKTSDKQWKVEVRAIPGRRELTIEANGHIEQKIEIEFRDNAVHEIPPILLKAMPIFPVVVLDLNRNRMANVEAFIYGSTKGSRAYGKTDEFGLAKISTNLTSSARISLRLKNGASWKQDIRLEQEAADSGEEHEPVEIVLPSTTVYAEIEVTGIPTDLIKSRFRLFLKSVDGEETYAFAEREANLTKVKFRFACFPGTYRVAGETSMLEVDSLVSIEAGSSPQETRVRARRKN